PLPRSRGAARADGATGAPAGATRRGTTGVWRPPGPGQAAAWPRFAGRCPSWATFLARQGCHRWRAAICEQRPQPLQCAGGLAFDRADRDAQRRGGVSLGQIQVIAQHDACPFARGEPGQCAQHVRAGRGLGVARDSDVAPGPDLPQSLAEAGPGQVDDRRAQVRRRRLLAADGAPVAPGPDEGFLAQLLSQAPVAGQGKGQPHQLRVVTLVQLGQAIVAAGLHVGKTAAAPKRLPRTLSGQPSPPGGVASSFSVVLVDAQGANWTSGEDGCVWNWCCAVLLYLSVEPTRLWLAARWAYAPPTLSPALPPGPCLARLLLTASPAGVCGSVARMTGRREINIPRGHVASCG